MQYVFTPPQRVRSLPSPSPFEHTAKTCTVVVIETVEVCQLYKRETVNCINE